MRNPAPRDNSELEALEQREWRESLDYVIQQGDRGRVQRLLSSLRHHARVNGVALCRSAPSPPYVNTIPPDEETPLPGSQEIERRIKSLIRWNAMAMVVRANRVSDGIGGHISTYASAATLYEVGFNHFFRGKGDGDGDIIYFQGHASPGIYARAFLEGRLSVEKLENFRRELKAGRRPVLVSASVADARLLAVPHRLDGARADHVDLPGALQSLPGGSRAEAAVGRQGVGVPRRRRDRRARSARRDQSGGARKARQPDLGHQLQPAAPRRPGARQRPDHAGARSDVPRRGLERHQGAVGQRLGSAVRARPRRPARQAHGRGRRRPVSEVRRRIGRLLPRALLRHRSAAARDGQAPVGRSAEAAAARRPRSGQGLQRLQGAPSKPRASRPSSWPARSRAMGWARPAKARTSRTSRRR